MAEKLKPLVSPEKMEKLRLESEAILEGMEDREPAVGDALFVHYDKAWASKNHVGQFGRMTLKSGEPLFHAAPSEIDRGRRFIMPEHDFCDFAKSWTAGGSVPVPLDRMLRGPAQPKPIVHEQSFRPSQYEKNLFAMILSWGPLVLVNPSFKSMSNALASVKKRGLQEMIYVTITASWTEDWAIDILDFVRKSEGQIQVCRTNQMLGIAYLGTNVPLWYPDNVPWVRMIHSPYIDPACLFENYSVEYRDHCFISRYQKKQNYEVVSILSRDTDKFVYNPETVDRCLEIKGTPGLYFMESSVPLDFKQVDDRVVWHSTWFIDMPEGIEILAGGLEAVVEGREVFDVMGEGTYLSRRMRTVLPFGYTWAPFQSTGTHWITYSSLKPHKDYSVTREIKKDKNLLNFGRSELVTGIRQVRAKWDQVFVSRQRPPANVFCWQLDSEDLMLAQRPIPEDYLEFSTEAFMDDKGKVFSKISSAHDAIIFHPKMNGKQVLPFLPFGEVRYAQRFRTRNKNYVSVDTAFDGVNFVFATINQLEHMIPSLSKYSGRWHSMKSIVEGTPDPERGGGVTIAATDQKILSLMTKDVVLASDDGITARAIAREVGISQELAFHHLSKTPNYCLWRPGPVFAAQFVSWDMVQEVFPGTVQQNDLYFANGRSWKDVFMELSTSCTKIYIYGEFPRQFLSLLIYNRFLVHEQNRGLYRRLHVKRPKR